MKNEVEDRLFWLILLPFQKRYCVITAVQTWQDSQSHRWGEFELQTLTIQNKGPENEGQSLERQNLQLSVRNNLLPPYRLRLLKVLQPSLITRIRLSQKMKLEQKVQYNFTNTLNFRLIFNIKDQYWVDLVPTNANHTLLSP